MGVDVDRVEGGGVNGVGVEEEGVVVAGDGVAVDEDEGRTRCGFG